MLRPFLRVPFRDKLLLPETLLSLVQATIMLKLIPFKRIAQSLGTNKEPEFSQRQPHTDEEVLRVRRSIRRIARHAPRGCSCLIQAVAGKKMLDRRGISSVLYLGVLTDDEAEKGMKAHAWLQSGNHYLTGKEGVDLSNFAVVAMFTSDGK